MTIISDFAGSPDPSYLLENIVAIIKMGVNVFFKRAFSKWGNGWVHYIIILFSNDVMRQFCKCSWTFWKACFLPKKKNHLLFFMVGYLEQMLQATSIVFFIWKMILNTLFNVKIFFLHDVGKLELKLILLMSLFLFFLFTTF